MILFYLFAAKLIEITSNGLFIQYGDMNYSIAFSWGRIVAELTIYLVVIVAIIFIILKTIQKFKKQELMQNER